jgi:hypothetical protein
MIEIGNWFMSSGGIHMHLDTENKTSASMLDAMTWHRKLKCDRIFKICHSTDEWQRMVITLIEDLRKLGPQEKGKRIPVFITVDSLTGRGTEDEDKALRKEGAAPERGYPIKNLQITNFLEALNLLGTTVSVGWVQHMKQTLDQTGYGIQYKEKGATAAQFACSTHIRVSKEQTPYRAASHDSAPYPEYPVEGHTLWLKTARSGVGPGNRTLAVKMLWQFVPQEDGSTRQAMWFDWHGALGEMLQYMQYSDDSKLFKHDKDRLKEALRFTNGKGKTVNCDELELSDASYTQFGEAIYKNNEVYDRVSKFLSIVEYPSVQTADIDFAAGTLSESKKRK